MPIQKNVTLLVTFQSVTTSNAANTATTPTVTLSKDGAAPAAATNAAAHVGTGAWKIQLTQTEMNADLVTLVATGTGLVPTQLNIYTESSYTSARATSIDYLDVSVASRLATAGYTAPPSSATIATASAAAILATPAQKLVTDASGYVTSSTVVDKAGYKLALDGLDLVTVETGLNGRQALQVIAAACAGGLSGAGTGTVIIAGAGVATQRILATTDTSGNRTAVTLSPSA